MNTSSKDNFSILRDHLFQNSYSVGLNIALYLYFIFSILSLKHFAVIMAFI